MKDSCMQFYLMLPYDFFFRGIDRINTKILIDKYIATNQMPMNLQVERQVELIQN